MTRRFETIFILALSFLASGAANVTEKSPMSSIPAGSKLHWKTDVGIMPNTTTTAIPAVAEDADEDGVPDYMDWCPGTPKGHAVWRLKDADSGTVAHNHIGCAGVAGEKWLYSPKESWSRPSGNEMSCYLTHDSSPQDRTLSKDQIFEVLGGESVDDAMGILSVKIPGGAAFEIACAEVGKLMFGSGSNYQVRNGWYRAVPSIRNVQRVLAVDSLTDPIPFH